MPDALDLTHDLRELVRLAASDDGVDDLMRRGLDWLTRLAPYDLATVFELSGDQLVVRAARGKLADERVKKHSLKLAEFPTIREAIETRRARAFTDRDHAHGDGDPFDGILDLEPGHSCMVVPLCAGDRCLGVTTLDRVVCEPYPPAVVDLVEVYCQVLAMAIRNAEQRFSLERLHRQDHEHLERLSEETGETALRMLLESQSPRMVELLSRARQVAATDTPVWIVGEGGSGREQLARALHALSARRGQPFVALNCAALPPELVEAELFGAAASSGAAARAGRFQMANGGSLLLSEIGGFDAALQAKLLRVVSDGRFESIGATRSTRVDVRLMIAAGSAEKPPGMLDELFYRLSVFPLAIPALRERREDLPLLCAALLAEQARRTGRRHCRVTARGLAKLAAYDWPGNLRELVNVLERAVIMSRRNELDERVLELPARHKATLRPGASNHQSLAEVQRDHIRRILRQTDGKLYGPGGAAEILRLKPSTLQSKMKKLGLDRRAVLEKSDAAAEIEG